MAQYTVLEPGFEREYEQNALMTDPDNPLSPVALRSAARPPNHDRLRIGPLEKVYLIWIVGASCDGCTVAVSGATHPRVEDLLNGTVPGLPRVEIVHTVLSVESGAEWVENLRMAAAGELDAPYVLCWEGSIMDETLSGNG